MDSRRQAYLHAMGLTAWEARSAAAEPTVEPEAAAAEPARPAPAPAPEPTAAPQAPPIDHGPAAPQAPESTRPSAEAIAAMDWVALQACVADCTACELHKTRTRTVFGVGNKRADWMIIGEAPGAEEDRRGEPFVGKAGQLLDSILHSIGLSRETAFIANILKCRPPGNRDPKAEEAEACRAFLERQIALVQPRLLLAVGRVPIQNLLGSDEPVGRLRGRVHEYAGVPLIATYHPAYLLRTPAAKAKVWDDLKLAIRTLGDRQ